MLSDGERSELETQVRFATAMKNLLLANSILEGHEVRIGLKVRKHVHERLLERGVYLNTTPKLDFDLDQL